MRPILSTMILAAVACASPASAHARLERASPAAGSHVGIAPPAVRLSFSEAVEPAFSTVRIDGPHGFGGAGRPASEAGGRTLAVPLRAPRPSGRYVVHWRAVSVDSHVTQGQFSFEVAR